MEEAVLVLMKTPNFEKDWEDIKWFSSESHRGGHLKWIDQFCSWGESNGKIVVKIDHEKCFRMGIDSVVKLTEAFQLLGEFVRECGRRKIVLESSIENFHMVEDYFEKHISPFYEEANQIYITKNLELYTQSFALAKQEILLDGKRKYIGPLRAWTKWDCKERKGKLYYRGIIQAPKAVNKTPSWKGDRVYFEDNGYEVGMLRKTKDILNNAGAIQDGKYKKVLVKPHKKTGGILVSLYWQVSEDIIRRMTENCSVKVNNTYDKETGKADSETQYFIRPAEPFVRGDQIRFVGYYFTVPQVERFFKARGYRVRISPKLLEQQKFKKLPFKLRLRYHPHAKSIGCGKACNAISAKYRKKSKQMYLWEHQEEAINNWKVNGDLGTVAIPTGGGKTLCLVDAVRQLNTWSLFLVPTIELKDQLINTLVKRLGVPRAEIGEFWGEKKQIKSITVGLLQSAHKATKEKADMTPKELERAEKFIQEFGDISKQFGFLGVDEGHHLPAPVWKLSGVHIKTFKRMSCTATPERDDKNEPLLYFMMGDVVYRCGYGDLAQKGIVCPIDYKRVYCKLEKDDREMLDNLYIVRARNEYGQYRFGRNEQTHAKKKLLDLYHQKHKFGKKRAVDSQQALLYGKRLNIQPRYIHGFSQSKFVELKRAFAKHESDKKIIFQQFVMGAAIIKEFLDEEFPNQKDKVQIITGETKLNARKQIFSDFKSGVVHTIITTTVLDEGINVPDCSVVIIVNGTSSPRQTIQRIGRGCRYTNKGKIESVYELVSWGDNPIERFDYWRLPYADRIKHDIFCAEQVASEYRNPDVVIKPSIQKDLIKRALKYKSKRLESIA